MLPGDPRACSRGSFFAVRDAGNRTASGVVIAENKRERMRSLQAKAKGEVNVMKQVNPEEPFEEVLLSYTEMCYAVALALTRSPGEARDLTRDVLVWAWHLRGSPNAETSIKRKLLKNLRERFLNGHGMGTHSARVVEGARSRSPMHGTV